jgi:hypothetical protein
MTSPGRAGAMARVTWPTVPIRSWSSSSTALPFALLVAILLSVAKLRFGRSRYRERASLSGKELSEKEAKAVYLTLERHGLALSAPRILRGGGPAPPDAAPGAADRADSARPAESLPGEVPGRRRLVLTREDGGL